MNYLSNNLTNGILKKLTLKVQREYRQIGIDVVNDANKYFDKFRELDAKKARMVRDGRLSKAEYQTWRRNKMLYGQRYTDFRGAVAHKITQGNQIVASYINKVVPKVFSLNANYEQYIFHTEKGLSFTLWNQNAVDRLLIENPRLLPKAKVNIPRDLRWNEKKISQTIASSIVRGKSIPDIANELQRVTNMNKNSAIRNARTMVTSAQNAGRLITFNEVSDMGIEILKVWDASNDSRVRRSHSLIDGEAVQLHEEFSNGLMYPADPDGDPEEVYNCRCAMISDLAKHRVDKQAERRAFEEYCRRMNA